MPAETINVFEQIFPEQADVILKPLHTPKFKTGETVQSIYNLDFKPVIIGDYYNIYHNYLIKKYFHYDEDRHNGSCPQKTLYVCYDFDCKWFEWVFESAVEIYCSNTFRGKQMLKSIPTVNLYGKFRVIDKNKFIKDFLS